MCKDPMERVEMDNTDHILVYTFFMSLYLTVAPDRNAEPFQPSREESFLSSLFRTLWKIIVWTIPVTKVQILTDSNRIIDILYARWSLQIQIHQGSFSAAASAAKCSPS